MNLLLILLASSAIGGISALPQPASNSPDRPKGANYIDLYLIWLRLTKCQECLDICARLDNDVKIPEVECPLKCTGRLQNHIKENILPQLPKELGEQVLGMECKREDDPHWVVPIGQHVPDEQPDTKFTPGINFWTRFKSIVKDSNIHRSSDDGLPAWKTPSPLWSIPAWRPAIP
ncbi:MAG: hypothetical protein M1816_003789 [Peltula sp. TS41687]|nr:MAG: hypothetical protein M1816_003789 [Peltula sp. TS41687]